MFDLQPANRHSNCTTALFLTTRTPFLVPLRKRAFLDTQKTNRRTVSSSSPAQITTWAAPAVWRRFLPPSRLHIVPKSEEAFLVGVCKWAGYLAYINLQVEKPLFFTCAETEFLLPVFSSDHPLVVRRQLLFSYYACKIASSYKEKELLSPAGGARRPTRPQRGFFSKEEESNDDDRGSCFFL